MKVSAWVKKRSKMRKSGENSFFATARQSIKINMNMEIAAMKKFPHRKKSKKESRKRQLPTNWKEKTTTTTANWMKTN